MVETPAIDSTNGPRRVVVLGAGAIGASVGALLFEAGVDSVLVARGEHGRAIAERGVELRFSSQARRIRVPTVGSLAAVGPTRLDLVLLATMGHDTEVALASLDRAVPIASFQNGVAPLESIARRGHPTLAAVVYLPAERRSPGLIALPAVPVAGSILVGNWVTAVSAWARWLVARLCDAGLRADTEAHIAPWVRAKLLINLGGIVGALSDAAPVDVIEAAQVEARAVWRARGERFEEIPALMKRVGPLELALVDGQERVGGSTRAALARGDRLETGTLHGTIVSGGRAVGVTTPVNERLIVLAELASRERWTPGMLTAEELRHRVYASA